MEKIVPILYLLSVLLSDISNYDISMWGVGVANVSITSKKIVKNDLDLKKIIYKSSSKSLANFIYPVSNYYETIINQNNILKFKKYINQKDYKEKIDTYRKNDTTFYKNDQFICNNCHNIFSLLDLAKENPRKAINDNFVIDRDGELFNASFKLVSKKDSIIVLELNIDLNKNQEYMPRKYDIFLWGIFLPNCKRLIWINTDNNKIIKCKFVSQFATLEANLIK